MRYVRYSTVGTNDYNQYPAGWKASSGLPSIQKGVLDFREKCILRKNIKRITDPVPDGSVIG